MSSLVVVGTEGSGSVAGAAASTPAGGGLFDAAVSLTVLMAAFPATAVALVEGRVEDAPVVLFFVVVFVDIVAEWLEVASKTRLGGFCLAEIDFVDLTTACA